MKKRHILFFTTGIIIGSIAHSEILNLECITAGKQMTSSVTYIVDTTKNTILNTYNNEIKKATISPDSIRWQNSFSDGSVSESTINRYSGVRSSRYIHGSTANTLDANCEIKKERKF
jgi:hypothetical protein